MGKRRTLPQLAIVWAVYNYRMAKNVIRISEAEAASEFTALMARVRAGAEVIIESGKRPVAVLHAAEPVRRTVSECITLAKAHEDETGKAPVLDPDFAQDVKNRHPRLICLQWPFATIGKCLCIGK